MNRKEIYFKIYSVIILTVLITCGLVYLIFNTKSDKPGDHTANTADENVVSYSPSPAVPSETAHSVSSPDIQPSETADVTDIDVVSDDSIQKVVNRTHTVDASYVPSDLIVAHVFSNGEQMLRKEAADALVSMFQAAQSDGISLYLISGYRSYVEQSSLYYTYEEKYGHDYAESIDDRPGQSEHQLGLAVDLGSDNRNNDLSDSFDTSAAYSWLQNHCAEYGFIERYPLSKESITTVAYSPWHYRYIGVDEAEKIKASGQVMEEYYHLQ